MIRSVFALALVFAAAPVVAADDARSALARRYLEVNGALTPDRVDGPLLDMAVVFAKGPPKARFTQAEEAALRTAVTEAYVRVQADSDAALVARYAETFTEEELRALLALFDGPLGAGILEKHRALAGSGDDELAIAARASAQGQAAFCATRPKHSACGGQKQ